MAGKTIIITLTGDTWVAAGATFDAQRLAILAAALAGALSAACETVAAWAEASGKAATRRELHNLSDHALRDIGLHRSQIDALYR